MFEIFLDFFMLGTAFLIPALVLVMFAISGKTAGFGDAEMLRLLVPMGALFGLWFGFVAVSAKAGLLARPFSLVSPPYILLFLLGGSLLFWGYVRFTPLAHKAIKNADQSLLTSLQIPRLAGGIFVIAWYVGILPWQFAFPAAIGDTIVGILAIQATLALVRKDVHADQMVKRTNVWGIIDFIVAVGAGVVSSEGMLRLFAHGQVNVITQYPLVLIPGFLIPIFLGLHLFSLGNLRRSRRVVVAELH